VAVGQAEENVTLTGGLAVLATGVAEVVPGTPGLAAVTAMNSWTVVKKKCFSLSVE
jgi:hypothetical protein